MAEAGLARPRRYAWLNDAVTAEGLVLTASRRLARELREAFEFDRMESGALAWDTPNILFWQDWCRQLLLAHARPGSRVQISTGASAILWERCLRKHLEEDLPGLRALRQQAMNARQRLAEWQVSLDSVAAAAGNRDERLFAKSAADYERELAAQACLDAADLPAAAIDLLDRSDGIVPERIVLAGFDQTTPVVWSLVEALRRRGAVVTLLDAAEPAETIAVHVYPDVETELRAAGAWARKLLEANPALRIAVVAADLNTEADRYARLIREGLAPGWQQAEDGHRHAVNVSYGRRLNEYPALSTALTCLRWISGGIDSRQVSILIRSPFLRGYSADAAAALDLQLRRLPDRQWTAAMLADALSNTAIQTSGADRIAAFRRIAELQIRSTEPASPGLWAETIHELLEAMGWPGEGVLDSDDFQLVNRWRELLNELSALGNVAPTMTLQQAVSRLGVLAGDAVFQPDSGVGLVSLLGPLEAAGMVFDKLWIAGMNAAQWPAPGRPLALVSRRLQRELAMPDATPSDTLGYARRVLDRLTGSAGEVRGSWSRMVGDAVQLPSPLLRAYTPGDEAGNALPQSYASTLLGTGRGGPVEVDPAPAVVGSERLAGGVRVVVLQWQDPFSAFAVGRLGIGELAAFESGLTPRLRGIVLHDALENLLRERPSSSAMARWSENERETLIRRAVDRAINGRLQFVDAVLRRLLALERTRLRLMLAAFLRAEAERQPFQVERVEERLPFEHAGLSLQLRADRIDSLADGSIVIADYKSGNSKKTIVNKDGDLVEPQLMVYAAATNDPVSGLVLICVRARSIEYVGVGGEWGRFDADTWPDALAGWRERVLESLEAIAAGDVRLDLSPGNSPCPQLDVLSRREELRRDR